MKEDQTDYQSGRRLVQSIEVTNDSAVRGSTLC